MTIQLQFQLATENKNDKLTTLTQHCNPWDDKMKNHIKSPDTVRELNQNINVALVAVLRAPC